MLIADLLAVLFPHFARLRVESMDVVGRTVRIRARGHEPSTACPGCGTVSTRVHSRYERKISDTAISNQQALIHLQVRRFFCDSAGCERRTFVEQIPELMPDQATFALSTTARRRLSSA
ncbi:transposase family protein [Streptomyces antarcticus]|uniref:transposase family protein n=1 Tax=Streptomyces antarcticus TaxID=2996458 RepID=UPI00226F98AF|nr:MULTISPECIES: transposase family protein [unclassified Streptomyces]MCY0947668.1 transposase family protein [Streptomyces sp. H34-AA3]MCZ4087474.1 transposase family protein [Streptomyces sp. H34-S5]